MSDFMEVHDRIKEAEDKYGYQAGRLVEIAEIMREIADTLGRIEERMKCSQ